MHIFIESKQLHLYIYIAIVYIYIYIYMYVCIYIYMYTHRDITRLRQPKVAKEKGVRAHGSINTRRNPDEWY